MQRVADLEVAFNSVDKKVSGERNKSSAFAAIKIKAKRVFIAYYMRLAREDMRKTHANRFTFSRKRCIIQWNKSVKEKKGYGKETLLYHDGDCVYLG